MATLGPFTLPQNQAVTCATDAATGLVDCGNWAVSASWPSTGAVSGIYVAKLTRNDTGGSSHIVFIVRDDARQADAVVQTSDTTWQAYNRYGGGSLYCGGPISNAGTAYATACATRSAKVSYNRPFDTRGHDAQSFLFGTEYPMVRWLEANGYNVKYWAGVDTDRRGADLTGARKPKVFFSVGHDEYWSGNQRTMVETARGAGVNLAFFSGNEMYWKTRYEPSIDGSNTAYRTLVSYKETLASAKIDPAVERVDRHVARSALQPSGRRRAPGEQRDRHYLDGQRRDHRDYRSGLDGPPALLAEHENRVAHFRRGGVVSRIARL